MGNVLKLLAISRPQLVQTVLLSVLAGLSNTALLYLVSHSAEALGGRPLLALTLFGVALLGFVVAQRVLLGRIVWQSERVLRQLRVDLSQRLLRCEYALYETIGRAKLLSALTHDATVLGQFWPMLINLIVATVTIVSSLLYLSILAPLPFLLTLLAIALGFLVYGLITTKARAMLESARNREDLFLAIVDDLLDGMKELKINRERRAALYEQELATATTAYLQESTAAKMAYHDAGLAGNGIFFVLVGLVAFVFPGLQVIDADARFAFLVVLLYLMGPLVRITANLPFITNAQVSARRILSLRERLARAAEHSCTVVGTPRPSGFPDRWHALRLTQVRYVYAEKGSSRSFELGPLTLELDRAQILFVVGGNGSGKSTLGKLLTGLYLPTSGHIALDAVAVDISNLDGYRQLFSAVFSDFHLFERLTGLTDAAKAAAPPVLAELDLPPDLVSTPDRARFSSLSKGQQRRLALVLARLEDRPIYFFDEWAADQDPAYRTWYYTHMLPTLKSMGKTVIAVTHDDRYFHVADRLLKLDKGKIVTLQNALAALDGPRPPQVGLAIT